MNCIRKAASIVAGLVAFFAAWSQALGQVTTVSGSTTCSEMGLGFNEFSITDPVNGNYAIDANNSLQFQYYDSTNTVFFFTESTLRMEGVLVLAGGVTVVWDIPSATGWPSLHAALDPATGQPYQPERVTFCYDDPAPTYACTGFETPFDETINLKKSSRAIPLKAILQEQGGALVTPTTLNGSAGPVVQVSFQTGIGGGVDVTSELLPVGQSSDGNQFNFDPTTSTWWLNLGTSPYTAKGTYVISLLSGDATKYTINPECTGSFNRD